MRNTLAIRMICRGYSALIKNFLHFMDNLICGFPYLFIILTAVICTVIGIYCVGKARAERDYANREMFLMEQKLDSMGIVIK